MCCCLSDEDSQVIHASANSFHYRHCHFATLRRKKEKEPHTPEPPLSQVLPKALFGTSKSGGACCNKFGRGCLKCCNKGSLRSLTILMLLGAPRAASSLAISRGHAPRVSGTAWSLSILLNSLSLPHAAAWEYIRAMAGEALMLVNSEQCLSLCSSLIHSDLTDVSTPSCWMCLPS